MANSSSTSSKSEITCIQPWPSSRSAPAIAPSSASSAFSVGIERPSSVLWFSVREVEKPRAPALIPSAGKTRHLGAIPLSRWFAIGTTLAHHEHPQRRMRHLRRDIHVVSARVKCVEEIREALPVPRQTFGQHHLGNVLDTLHQLHQHVALRRLCTARSQPAIAEQRSGHTVPGRRRDPAAPRRLRVIVRVRINEAGRHHHAARIDLLAAPPGYLANTQQFCRRSTATSASNGAAPVPSITMPLRMTKSAMVHNPSLLGETVTLREILQLLPGGVLDRNAVLAPVLFVAEFDLAGIQHFGEALRRRRGFQVVGELGDLLLNVSRSRNAATLNTAMKQPSLCRPVGSTPKPRPVSRPDRISTIVARP